MAALITLFATATAFADITGTYVLEFEGMGQGGGGDRGEMTLTLAVDDEGNYSAKLAMGSMGESEGSDVEVDGNEFSFTVTRETPRGDFSMTYSGTVEDGELTGSIGTDWGDNPFTGKLKEEESEEEGDDADESGEGASEV